MMSNDSTKGNNAEGFRFDPDWRTSLFTALMLPLLVVLGFWQLQRADEKVAIEAAFAAREAQPPAAITSLQGQPPETLAYRRVQLRGEYLQQRSFLLDNRIANGRFGYEVVTPLQLADSKLTVLVNRGWIIGDPARRELPALPDAGGLLSLTGRVYVPPGAAYTLGDVTPGPEWPKVVQTLSVPELSEILGPGVFPHIVRLDKGQPSALFVNWTVVNQSPAKHHGYAVQWFSMAAVLALFYLLRSSNLSDYLRRKRKETTS